MNARGYKMKTLYRKIRYAEESDNPLLFVHFLELEFCKGNCNLAYQRQRLISQFQLLIDTMSDELLPVHWRKQCLDNIHQPLFKLQRLVNSDESAQQVKALFYELRIMSQYIKPGLST